MHTFTYSILPHFEDNYFETFAAAYFLNSPIRVVKAKSHGSNLNGLSRIFSVDASNAIIDTIKISEDDPKCLIVRIFEAMGGQSKVNLRTAIPFEKAVVCDLLERGTPDISDLQIQECEGYFSVLFELNPFQVISVKLLAK
jgi:alpha-mannosidase